MTISTNNGIKCLPVDRTWPDRCARCKDRNLPCSEPQLSSKKKVQGDGRTPETPRTIDSSDESDSDRSVTINRSTKSRRTGSLLRFSDVVDQVVPPRSDYKYTPLKDDEIRLLVLQPGEFEQELVCFLVPRSLGGNREYEAVSYIWGSDQATDLINIVSYKSGSRPKSHSSRDLTMSNHSLRDLTVSKTYVKSNLYAALRHLRHAKQEITLWVDALCINHDDRDEKASQVSKKIEIYNQASNVIVWLGLGSPSTSIAFNFIPEVLNLNRFDELVKDPSKLQCWRALAELMKNPLFDRRWFIQEFAVAKNATLRCGVDSIPWDIFSDAVALFEAKFYEIQRFNLPAWIRFDNIQALNACQLVKMADNVVRKSPEGKILNRRKDLETLVSISAAFEAGDPRDTLFSLFGLAEDQSELWPMINYRKTVLDVFTDFVKLCTDSGSIDIICRHWAPVSKAPQSLKERLSNIIPAEIDLPSWMPKVNGSAFGLPQGSLRSRVNGDSFVGLPGQQIYNAAKGFPPCHVRFGRRANVPAAPFDAHGVYNGNMEVKGFVLDIIGVLSSRNAEGFIFREALQMGGWRPFSEHAPGRLWRTLVADRSSDNSDPPSWYRTACLGVLAESSNSGDINTTVLLSEPKCPQVLAHFLRRVQSVIWNRKFFLSREEINGDRLFGLAPEYAEVGDLICIIYGCSVPVILRKRIPPDSITPDDHYFELIGESFVYGMMDGEAYKTMQRLSLEDFESRTRTFKLH